MHVKFEKLYLNSCILQSYNPICGHHMISRISWLTLVSSQVPRIWIQIIDPWQGGLLVRSWKERWKTSSCLYPQGLYKIKYTQGQTHWFWKQKHQKLQCKQSNRFTPWFGHGHSAATLEVNRSSTIRRFWPRLVVNDPSKMIGSDDLKMRSRGVEHCGFVHPIELLADCRYPSRPWAISLRWSFCYTHYQWLNVRTWEGIWMQTVNITWLVFLPAETSNQTLQQPQVSLKLFFPKCW